MVGLISIRKMHMLKKAYLEITNVCNLTCAFCPGTKREPRFMTAEQFAVLAGKLRPYTQYLYLHLMGEPLLHPQLASLLEIAQGLEFKVVVTTNGTLLAERGESLVASAAVHKVNISLQSFEANEIGGLPCYISSCAAFAKMAAKAGKICVLRLWNSKGMDALNADILSELEKSFAAPWAASRSGAKLQERVWLEHGEKFDWPDLNADDYGERGFCYGLRDQIGVLCDGTVVPCCLDHEGDIPLGNLFENELDEIMSNKKARDIYDGFSQRHAVEELCRRCGYSRRFT